MLSEQVAIFLAQNCPTAGGEHNIIQAHELAQDGRFARAESQLAFDFENHGDLDSRAALNFVVAVVESLIEMPGQQAADGSLAGAHQADEVDVSRYCQRRLR